MEKVIHKAKDHKEAREYDIKQIISLTPEERQKIVRELQRRNYGENCPDVRESKYLKVVK
jgi:hypothetical protein